MTNTLRYFQCLCLLFCIMLGMSACAQSTKDRTSAHPPASTPSTFVRNAVQTCPAPARIRAAHMPSIPSGNHPALIYSAQSTAINAPSDTTTLLRYDTVTAATTALLKAVISQSSISPDRQWVTLVASVQGQAALQIIRVDGQQLQTLYCAPAGSSISSMLLSPDQRSFMFVQTGDSTPTTLNRLDLTTGSLQTLYSSNGVLGNLLFSPDQRFLAFTEYVVVNARHEWSLDVLNVTTRHVHMALSSLQPGFPESDSLQPPASQSSRASLSSSYKQGIGARFQFLPFPSGGWDSLLPLQWANDTSLFLRLERLGSPDSELRLYLLRDTTRASSQQQSNLQELASNGDTSYLCDTFALTPDSQHLVCSSSPTMGRTMPATIGIRSVTSGTFHTIYHGPVGHVTVNIISNSTVLITQQEVNRPDMLWRINTDGSGLVQLMAAPSKDWSIEAPIISHGSLYALPVSHLAGNNETSLVVGSLTGGTPKSIVETNTLSLELLGWVRS